MDDVRLTYLVADRKEIAAWQGSLGEQCAAANCQTFWWQSDAAEPV